MRHQQPTSPKAAYVAPDVPSTPPSISPRGSLGKRTRDATDTQEYPKTPTQRRQPNELDTIMRKIEQDWGFRLLPPDQDWSPFKRRPACLEDQCRDLLQRLFWRSNVNLSQKLEEYNELFPVKTTASLLQMLRGQAQKAGCISSQFSSTSTSFMSNLSTQPDTANTSFAESFDGKGDVSFLDRLREPKSSGLGTVLAHRGRIHAWISKTDTQTAAYGDDLLCTQDFMSMDQDWNGLKRGGEISKASAAEEVEPLPAINLNFGARKALEQYQIRDLPKNGLFVDELPSPLNTASARIRYECIRLRLAHQISLSRLAELYSETWEIYASFRSAVKSVLDTPKLPLLPFMDAWHAAGNNSEHVVRTGRLSFQVVKSGPLFNLTLHPLRLEPTSCRFFRKFGAHRFLKLLVPSYRSLPAHLKNNGVDYQARMQEWMSIPDKAFMGYNWSVFHVKPDNSRRKRGAMSDTTKEGLYQVYLFATTGSGLPTVSLAELLDWFLPVEKNKHMTCCKTFARLELGLSMTHATICFKPSQIQYANDKLANGQAEDFTLDDPAEQSHSCHDPQHPEVMNDGCARISQAAAQQVWLLLKGIGPCPSLFQARIGPWKGVWFLDEATSPSGNGKVWLEVAPSQQKFQHLDLDDNNFDPCRMTFEVVSWSRKATTSSLYVDFLPILHDRGVPRAVLKDLVASCLVQEEQELETATKDNALLLKWLQDNCSVSDPLVDGAGKIRGDMPMSRGASLRRLLESGFTTEGFTSESCYVQELLHYLLVAYFTKKSSLLDLVMPQSTFLYGIADPYGCLGPSEIHLSFSGIFGAESYPYLHDCEVLVARHPTLRRSDIQKVQAVFKLELRHLVDVVVFPSTGSVPLASKLQGGDYDGDLFWLCWDKSITKDFRNIAPPHEKLRPEALGITVDRTPLEDIISTSTSRVKEQTTAKFFAKCFEFAWRPSLLGICTIYFNDLCYSTNMRRSPMLEMYANLHDLLIDSSKNGYVFDDTDWNVFRQQHKDSSIKVKSAAYRKASEISLFDIHNKPIQTTFSKHNIVDHLIFEVARPHARAYLQNRKPSGGTFQTDPAISSVHTSLLRGDEMSRKIVLQLQKDIHEIHHQWKLKVVANMNKTSFFPTDGNETGKSHDDKYDEILLQAYTAYNQVQPHADYQNSELVKGWLQRALKHEPSQWERIKASVVAMLNSRFAFDLAGSCLCYIKAHQNEQGPPRTITMSVYRQMKVRPSSKRPVEHEDGDDFGQNDDDNENLGDTLANAEDENGPRSKRFHATTKPATEKDPKHADETFQNNTGTKGDSYMVNDHDMW